MRDRGWQQWFVNGWGYLVAVGLAIAAYLPAIAGEPIWDDVIVFERYLPTFETLASAFFPPRGAGELGQYYYRPFITLSYLLDVGVYGEERFVGHHLTGMLLHALATLGVGLLTRRLMSDGPAQRWAGFAAACCFAVHPVHVDSVAQISGRSDPMATMFLLAALLALLHGRDRPRLLWPWFAAAAAFLAGLFSKEVAAVGAVLGALLLWLPRRAPAAVWWRFSISFGTAGVVYLILRSGAGLSSSSLLELSLTAALERLVRAVGYYFEMVTIPVQHAAFVPLSSMPSIWLGVLAALLLSAAGVVAWRHRAAPAVLRVALVWFVVTLAPSLMLLFAKASEQPVAERYLYLPSIAVAMAFGWFVARLGGASRAAKPTAIVVTLLLLLGAVVTGLRSRVYVDNLTFWTAAAESAPNAGLPQYELGLTLRKAGQLDAAMQRLERALRLYDDAEGRGLALNTIGTIHLERREFDQAEQRFVAAVEQRPDYATPWFNLAGVYSMRAAARRSPQNVPELADLERCVQALGKAVEVRPNYIKARVQLARQSLQLTKVYLVQQRGSDADRMRSRAKSAADWLVGHDPKGPLGQQGRAMLTEVGKLPR